MIPSLDVPPVSTAFTAIGIKHTDFGAIPTDWEVRLLGELSIAGPTNGYSGPTQEHDKGTLTLRLSATSEGRFVINSDTTKRLRDTIPASSDLYLAPGDLLIQRSNTLELVGTAAVFDGPPGKFIYPDLMTRFRFDSLATSQWVWRFLNSHSGRRIFRGLAAGSTGSMPKLSGASLKTVALPLPPLPEQRAIAEALGDVDALIAAQEKLIAKKRAIKTATTQLLLTGKQRLPGFGEGCGYKQTEIGVIPEDWVLKQLGPLTVKVGSGVTPTGGSKVYQPSGRPFIRSQNIGWGKLRLNDLAYIDEETHQTFSGSEICEGDVLLNITGASIGRVAVASDEIADGNVNQHVCIIRTKPEQLYPLFLSSFLLSSLGQAQVDSFQAGGNREGLNFGQIKSFLVPLCSVKEQSAIAEVLSDSESEILALEKRLSKTKSIKQGMMQELLTGRTRLV